MTPKRELLAQLKRIEKAGRTCYQSEKKPVTNETAGKFVKMLLSRGHESVLEHTSLTVKFQNLSRGFTHEIVRHRLASFSQESTRYVDYAKKGTGPDLAHFQTKCVAPPHRDENQRVKLSDGREMNLKEMYTEVEDFYRGLRLAGWLPEDARQILPTGLAAEIVVTANWREWRHIFKMRTSQFAHWEIRGVMNRLLTELQRVLPAVFGDFVKTGEDANGLAYFEIDKSGKI